MTKELPADLPRFALETMKTQLAAWGAEPVCNYEGALTVLDRLQSLSDTVEKLVGALKPFAAFADPRNTDALAHELREQSRFPSGQPRISLEKAREIVAAALRSQPVEAGECEHCGGNGYSGGVNTGSGEYDDCCEVCLGSGKARPTSLSQQPAPEVQAIIKVRDGYASQAKFADPEPASYFREFVRRLDAAIQQGERG